MKNVSRLFSHPMWHDWKFFLYLVIIHIARYLPDEQFLKVIFHLKMGYRLDLKSPNTYCEKLNWLKLYDRNPIYTTMADKYAVKAFVAGIIGSEYVVENYGVWGKWEDINFEKLPNQFVLKGTHDSGGAFICRDKKTFNYEAVGKSLKHNLKRNFYYTGREWPYKNIPPRIIADRLLDDHSGQELLDYKFWCFNGKPKYMYCTIKGDNIFENFYDMDFNPVMINHGFPRHLPEFEKPSKFELMKELAEKLSKDIPFVRIDFFQVDGKVYFGEFTFYDWGGLRPFKTKDMDLELGKLLELPTRE